jgi:ethanolamine kinase
MSSSTGLPPVDSPMALRHIPYLFSNEDADHSALELVDALNSDWKEAEGPVEFVRFTDGITNTLTKAVKKRPGRTEAEIDDEAVLIRAYGKGTDVLIDRERELRAHNLLASMGLAPPLLARFDNGIMYKFIQGDVCTPEDLRRPDVYRAVAKRLGQWHGSLPISAITSTPDLRDEPLHKHLGARNGKQSRPLPNCWTVMQQWIDALPKGTEQERRRNEDLDGELAWLSDKLGDTPGLDGRNYVFGHCDLLSGNVIVQRPADTNGTNGNSASKERPVSFIDYEYATPAPAAFDISNHFAEWAGFNCDHGAVPTRSQRIDFLRSYVGSFRYHSISDDDNLAIDIDLHNDVAQLYQQVDLFRGIPGFYWGIWALIQATISQIDFDYASYAELRLGEYWAWKAESDGSRERSGKEMPLRERRWAEE